MSEESVKRIAAKAALYDEPYLARDTQFAGFAELLWRELIEADETTHGMEQQRRIARRAYDLVYHAMQTPQSAASTEEVVRMVPDMTEWPKEQE